MPKFRRDVIAVVADSHCGSTTGLCTPSVQLDDGGTYSASKGQRWLYQSWGEYWGEVYAVKPCGGGALWAIHLGDVTDGDHHDTAQIVSRNPTTERSIAIELLEPVRKRVQHLFIVRGTEAHTGKSACQEEVIADDLHADRDTVAGTASWWHLPLTIQGVTFDCAHHPPSMPGREWTRGNAAVALASVIMAEYARDGTALPDYALRAHAHTFADSGETYRTRAVLCPAWQLATGFSNKRRPGQLSDIGGLLFVIEDGRATLRVLRYTPKRREPWKE